MKKAFTLLELLIVVIVIAVLATLAIPQYLNAVERGRVAKAKNAMRLIDEAEKMFRGERDTYVAVADGAFQATLGNFVELESVDVDPDWRYAVAARGGITDGFTITATKTGGRQAHTGHIITLTDQGVCGPVAGAAAGHPLRGRDCGG